MGGKRGEKKKRENWVLTVCCQEEYKKQEQQAVESVHGAGGSCSSCLHNEKQVVCSLSLLGLIWSIKQANIQSCADQEICSPSSGALNSVFSDRSCIFSLDEQKTHMIHPQLFTSPLCCDYIMSLGLAVNLPPDGHVWHTCRRVVCSIISHRSMGNGLIWKLLQLQLSIYEV